MTTPEDKWDNEVAEARAVSERTPGPWTAIMRFGTEPMVRTNAELKRWFSVNTEADARLIAAAPDLLEAAKLALQNQDENGYIGVQSCAEIRAAIAKAEGDGE